MSGWWCLCCSLIPAANLLLSLLDENANLGTAVRYEEIGQCVCVRECVHLCVCVCVCACVGVRVCACDPLLCRPTELRIFLLCGSDLLDSFCIPGLWKDSDVSTRNPHPELA